MPDYSILDKYAYPKRKKPTQAVDYSVLDKYAYPQEMKEEKPQLDFTQLAPPPEDPSLTPLTEGQTSKEQMGIVLENAQKKAGVKALQEYFGQFKQPSKPITFPDVLGRFKPMFVSKEKPKPIIREGIEGLTDLIPKPSPAEPLTTGVFKPFMAEAPKLTARKEPPYEEAKLIAEPPERGLMREIKTAIEFIKFPYHAGKFTVEFWGNLARSVAGSEAGKKKFEELRAEGVLVAEDFAGGVKDWLLWANSPMSESGKLAKQKIADRIKDRGYLAESVYPLVFLHATRGAIKKIPKRGAKVSKVPPERLAQIEKIGEPKVPTVKERLFQIEREPTMERLAKIREEKVPPVKRPFGLRKPEIPFPGLKEKIVPTEKPSLPLEAFEELTGLKKIRGAEEFLKGKHQEAIKGLAEDYYRLRKKGYKEALEADEMLVKYPEVKEYIRKRVEQREIENRARIARELKEKPVTEKPAEIPAGRTLSEVELKTLANEMLNDAKIIAPPSVTKGKRAFGVRVEYDPASTPPWYPDVGLNKTDTMAGLKSIVKDGYGAKNQYSRGLFEKIEAWSKDKARHEPAKAEITGGDLVVGDRVKIKGEWYTAKPEPKKGMIELIDDQNIRLDIFEKLPVQELQKAKPVVKAVKEPTEPSIIGLNKAEQNRIRRDLNLDKLEPVKRKRFERSLEEARGGKLDKNALSISDEVLKSKRPITDTEHAGMVIKSARLADEYNASIKEVSSLIEKGETGAAQMERTRADVIIDQLDKLTDASRQGGREVGRALSIRRMMVNRETYDLAHVIQRARASKGAKLTATESAKLERLTTENSALEATLKEIEAKYERVLAEKEKSIAEGITKRETRKARITRRTVTAKEEILSDRENVKRQLAEMGFRVNDVTGVTTEGAYLVGKLAVTYIKEGVVTLDGVVRKVLADLPQLTERDVYRSLAMKNHKAQARAKVEVTRRVARLKNQARLLMEVEKAEKGIFEPRRTKLIQSAEIKRLQRKLRDLRSGAYRTEFEAARLEKAITTINELQDQLANHHRTLRKGKTIDPPELAVAKKKLKEIRSALRVEDELVRLNEQLRTGEFEVKPKLEPKVLPPELERKQVELKMARRQIRATIDDMAPMTARKLGVEAINTARTAKATADMSGVLRQGLILSVRRPIKATKNFAKAFKSAFSEYTAEQIDHASRSVDHHYLREKAGLQRTEVGGRLWFREEMFMASLIKKVPVIGEIVKASDRHMTTFLNLMREDAFDQFLKKYPNATHAELKAWADAVNIFSGRGNLGRASGVANALSLFVFAPRFAISRIQTPYMLFKYWKMPRVRAEIAKDLTATATMGGTLLVLADLAGFEVGLNPRDPNWGKIRIGDTRIDVWGGVQQPMRLVTRIGLAATDRIGLTGRDLTKREKDIDPVELIGRFSAYKLAPSVTIPRELIVGKTMVGEPVTPLETGVRAVTPMVYESIYEAYKLEGVPRAALVGGLEFFGVSVSTYRDSEFRTRAHIRRMLKEGNTEGAYGKMFEWNMENPDSKISDEWYSKQPREALLP